MLQFRRRDGAAIVDAEGVKRRFRAYIFVLKRHQLRAEAAALERILRSIPLYDDNDNVQLVDER